MNTTRPASAGGDRTGVLLLALSLCAAAGLRLCTLRIPLERDEGEFAWGGWLLLQGDPPFRSFFTLKLPGTHALYAVSMALFGQSIAGIRLGLLLVNLASALLLFFLARRLIGRAGAVAAASAFACLSLSPALLGTFAHATHYVVFFALAGLLATHRALETKRLRLFALAGALLAGAVMMKQAGAVFAVFALGWAAASGRARLRGLLAFCAGLAAPFAVLAALLAKAGTLSAAVFWTFTYAHDYASATSLAAGLANLRTRLSVLVPQALGLLLFALAGGVAAVRSRERPRAFLFSFFALSAAGVCPGLYFRSHYFILALPALCLLAGLCVETLVDAGSPARRAAAVALFAAALSQPLASMGALLLSSPEQISRTLYGRNPFPEAVVIGRYLRERSQPGDRIAVLGSEPEILFYSQRQTATHHIYMYNLVEAQPFAQRMQDELMREVESSRPKYVVYVLTRASWLAQPGTGDRLFGWIDGFLARGYEKVGQVEAADPTHVRYLWGSHAAAPAGPFTQLQLFRRR